MKANELRIGNWIESKGKQIEVTCVDILNYWNTECYGVEPIPLTEEWLIKFGVNVGFLDFDSPKLTMSVNLDAKNGGYNELQIATSGTSDLIIECNYVHQLQNLYFALTGEELTLKQ
jgi:hypothetical protein